MIHGMIDGMGVGLTLLIFTSNQPVRQFDIDLFKTKVETQK